EGKPLRSRDRGLGHSHLQAVLRRAHPGSAWRRGWIVITAVDSSVLFDVFTADPTHGVRSRDALMTCIDEGSLVACEVVWAEVAAAFPSSDGAREALDQLGVTF